LKQLPGILVLEKYEREVRIYTDYLARQELGSPDKATISVAVPTELALSSGLESASSSDDNGEVKSSLSIKLIKT